MEIELGVTKRGRGQQLKNAERLVIISKMVDILSEGYVTTNYLVKKLKLNRNTVETYRLMADELIAKTKLDRNVIRNLQVKRTYNLIERLMDELKELKGPERVKERTLIYNQIYKFSSHLALITGLNVETTVNVDTSKLVIIRSDKKNRPEEVETAGREVLDASEGVINQ